MTDIDLRPQFPADYDSRQDGGRLIVNAALREMAWADYSAYLLTNHWQNVKAMAYRAYGRRCTYGANCEGYLDVHHHRYENLGNESADDLEVLCRKHHYAKHDARDVRATLQPPLSMPNRYLRESFIESERVNAVSLQAEIVWIHLIVIVDDFGRCEANPKLLRPKLFPLRLEQVREAELSRWLAECEKAGLLRLYSIEGKPYLQLDKWEQGRAQNSKHPPPPVSSGQQMLTAVNNGQPRPPTPVPTTTPIPTTAGEFQALPENLNTDEFKERWAAYCAHRREKRLRPLGPQSINEKWKELSAMGLLLALEAIRQSIANGWSGIFPPKSGGQIEETPRGPIALISNERGDL